MFAYVFLVVFCFLLSFIKQTKSLEVFAFMVISSILCFGYMTGSDWRVYELFYSHKVLYEKEIAYKYLNDFFSFIGVGFWPFFIGLKVILLAIFFFVYKRLGVPLLFCLMMFIVAPGLYMFVDNPMRNLIVYAIFAYSTIYIYRRDFIKFLLCTIIAFYFHSSAIIVLPLYFLYNVDFKKKTVIILFVVINVLFASQKNVLNFMELVANNMPVVGYKMLFYIDSFNNNLNLGDFESKIISLGLFVRIFGFIVLLYFKDRIISEFKFGRLVFMLSVFYLLLFRIALSFALFSRILIFFEIFYICAIGYIFMLLSNRNKIIVSTLIFFYLVLSTARITTKDFRYIPYTNYIIYSLKGEFPSFDERVNYNFIQSPYHIDGTEY